MDPILELLRDNEPLTAQLKGATSKESAVNMIVDAAGKRGKKLTSREVETFFAQKPKGNPEALSDQELEAVSGGMMRCSVALSDVCCYTCRTSEVSW